MHDPVPGDGGGVNVQSGELTNLTEHCSDLRVSCI